MQLTNKNLEQIIGFSTELTMIIDQIKEEGISTKLLSDFIYYSERLSSTIEEWKSFNLNF